MNSKTKNILNPNSIKYLAIIFSLAFTFLMIQSCSNSDMSPSETEIINSETRGIKAKKCNGKKVLVFNSLAELQQEHYALYQEYLTANEDEQVLIDFENNYNFYSLRKKENDMDDEVIPYDPSFDETEYTFDPVFETLLNQDGMIVIDGRLYLWSSGCVVQSVPFTCDNYISLLEFRTAALINDPILSYQLYMDLKMELLNICDAIEYDFEYVSENGGSVDVKDIPTTKDNNGCGYDVVLNKELISCENGRDIFKISFESIAPFGSSNPINLFYINGIFGNLEQIEYGFDLLGPFVPIPLNINNTNYGYLVPTYGELSFYMSVPQTPGMQIGIALSSAVNIGTGNGCLASDVNNIDMTCSFDIVATKIEVSNDMAEWMFSLPTGDAACGNIITQVLWNFGDGSPEVITTSTSISHVFTVPCLKTEYLVSAVVTGTICGQNLEGQLYNIRIPAGNACNRRTYKFPTKKFKIQGKRVKLASKIKKRGTQTIVKTKFKGRFLGDKTIETVGNFHSPNANNSGACNIIDVATLVPSKVTSGKKRNRQKVKIASINHINALDKYHIFFSHSNGFSYTLTASDLYCSE